MSQCEWILYESGHIFFLEASDSLPDGLGFFTGLVFPLKED